MTFEIEKYLERTGLSGRKIPVTPEGLAMLQLAQASAIAFENMDPLTGLVPDLAPAALWQKLVVNRRGGYCLELNALFGQALDALGFAARPVLGRVRMGAPTGGPRSHHAFVVSFADGDYLADTGFGGPAPAMPVRLGDSAPQVIRGETFRMRADAATGEDVLERRNGDDWFALYGFDSVEVEAPDYEAANFICARWDKAPFPFHLMMTIVTEDGRNNLFNREVKQIRGSGIETMELGSLTEFETAMMELFRLPPDRALYQRVWEKLSQKDALAA